MLIRFPLELYDRLQAVQEEGVAKLSMNQLVIMMVDEGIKSRESAKAEK